MNNLGNALKDAYAASATASRGVTRGPHRTIAAIRRRRTARAVGTGTAAAVGIGAVGAAWWLAPGGRLATPAVPQPSGTCADTLYLPPNPAALGDAPVLFRSYVDLRPNSFTHGVVVVTPDGTVTRVEPDADGEYVFEGSTIVYADWPSWLREQPMIGDQTESSGGGSYWDGVSPFLWDYHWTTVVPDEIPAGIDTASLSDTLRIATYGGGSGYQTAAVPDGAVTDFVITTTEGSESYRLKDGDPLDGEEILAGLEGLESVALRVSGLPGGETFTITSTYDDVDPALAACVVPSASPSPTPPSVPTHSPSSDPGISSAPGPSLVDDPVALGGPESAVFACGAPLPTELEGDLGLSVTWGDGTQTYSELKGSPEDALDLGDGGVLVHGQLPRSTTEAAQEPHAGWWATWTESGGTLDGVGQYTWIAAVRDGTIVGVLQANPDDLYGRGPDDAVGGALDDDGTGVMFASIANVEKRMIPCDGFTDADVAGADLVALLGTGMDPDSYSFAWTEVA